MTAKPAVHTRNGVVEVLSMKFTPGAGDKQDRNEKTKHIRTRKRFRSESDFMQREEIHMRITLQMLNESAMKAGQPLHQHTLMNYVNQSGQSNSLLRTLQSDTKTTASKTKYEKQERTSEELNRQLDKLQAEGDDSLFDKARESGDTSELCGEIKTLAARYNSLLSEVKQSTDAMDMFYKKSMQDLVNENSEDLAKIGISVGKKGNLEVDAAKLAAASIEDLEKVFGAKSSFASRLSFVSASIGRNADGNLESISRSYLSDGNLSSAGSYYSKYDSLV